MVSKSGMICVESVCECTVSGTVCYFLALVRQEILRLCQRPFKSKVKIGLEHVRGGASNQIFGR